MKLFLSHRKEISLSIVFFLITFVFVKHNINNYTSIKGFVPLLNMFQSQYYTIIISVFYGAIILLTITPAQLNEIIRYKSIKKFFNKKIQRDFFHAFITTVGIYLIVYLTFLSKSMDPFGDIHYNFNYWILFFNSITSFLFLSFFRIFNRWFLYKKGKSYVIGLLITNIFLSNVSLHSILGEKLSFFFPNWYFSFFESLTFFGINQALFNTFLLIVFILLLVMTIDLTPKLNSYSQFFSQQLYTKRNKLISFGSMILLSFYVLILARRFGPGDLDVATLLYADYSLENLQPIDWIFHILFGLIAMWVCMIFYEEITASFKQTDLIRFKSKTYYVALFISNLEGFIFLSLLIFSCSSTILLLLYRPSSLNINLFLLAKGFFLRFFEWSIRLNILLTLSYFGGTVISLLSVTALTAITALHPEKNFLNSSIVIWNAPSDILLWLFITLCIIGLNFFVMKKDLHLKQFIVGR